MFVKFVVIAAILLLPTNTFGEPRTLQTNLVKAQPTPPPQTHCSINPITWEIPTIHDQVIISYLGKNNKVIFERDFSVEGGNKIRIQSRKEQ